MIKQTLTISWIAIGALVSLPGSVYSQYSTKGGSLVIASSAKEGLILVADKKSVETHGKDSTFSETTKIYQLNHYYAFGIAGKLSINTGGCSPATFESVKVIRDFFDSNPTPLISQKLLEDLGNHVFDNFMPILEKIRMQRLMSGSPGHTETKLVDIALCGYDSKTNKYQFGILSVSYIEEYSLANGFSCVGKFTTAAYSDTYRAFRASTQISIAGKTHLANQLIRGQNEQMQKFLGNREKINFSSIEIIDFSKWLIEETSKVDKTVGESVDIAIIDEKGFRWVTK